jgi:hypothetical protein
MIKRPLIFYAPGSTHARNIPKGIIIVNFLFTIQDLTPTSSW